MRRALLELLAPPLMARSRRASSEGQVPLMARARSAVLPSRRACRAVVKERLLILIRLPMCWHAAPPSWGCVRVPSYLLALTANLTTTYCACRCTAGQSREWAHSTATSTAVEVRPIQSVDDANQNTVGGSSGSPKAAG